MRIKFISVGPWKENSYVLEYENQCLLIDPGDEFDKLDVEFSKNSNSFHSILNTHGHFDHIGVVEDFKLKYKIPFYLHSKDEKILRQANLYRKISGLSGFVKIPKVDHYLDNMTSFKFIDKSIRIHHIPGHTEGSVAFEIEDNLFSGDIIFSEQLGRTDLPGGNMNSLKNSVCFLIDNFKGFKIFPGHGQPFLLNDKVIAKFEKLI